MKTFVIVFFDNETVVIRGASSEKNALDIYDKVVGDFRGRPYKILTADNVINLELGDIAWLN